MRHPALLIAMLACLPAAGAAAAPPAGMQAAIDHGAALFAHDSFGGTGTCDTCHVNGGRSPGKLPNGKPIPSLIGAAATYPQYRADEHRVVTLSQQIHRCIAGALHGKPPAPDSTDLADLEAYVASLSQGAVLKSQVE